MKANFRQLKEWNQLKPSEQQRIIKAANDAENRDIMVVLDIFLKMSCSVLHNAFGFGEKRCSMYLANYRRLFAKHIRYVKRGIQDDVLNKEMGKIFKKNGYPDEFFKAMFADWGTETKKEVDE